MRDYSYRGRTTTLDFVRGLVKAMIGSGKFLLVVLIFAGLLYLAFYQLTERAHYRCLVTATDKTVCK